jgi:Fe-S-cluster containining protein
VSGDTIDAGSFSEWLEQIRAALDDGADAVVPCGACTACCTSSQFVHIDPDELDALAHIPVALRFPAPGLPDGHVVLGYDEHGRCPMLIEGACSIYEHRPRACRAYDCRVFAATGVEPDVSQPAVAAQVRRWRFSHHTREDRVLQDEIRAAVPSSGPPIERALRAVSSRPTPPGAPSPASRARRGGSPPGR